VANFIGNNTQKKTRAKEIIEFLSVKALYVLECKYEPKHTI
jgi:hypothetical protein